MPRPIAPRVLALALIAGCATTPTRTSAPAAMTLTPSPSQAPQTTRAPTPAPSPAVVCGAVQADCEKAIELVRAQAPADLVAADRIVVADICAPDVVCDRFWAFDSIVALVQARSLIAAFEVTGERGPEVASRVVAPLPAHVEALVRGASPTP